MDLTTPSTILSAGAKPFSPRTANISKAKDSCVLPKGHSTDRLHNQKIVGRQKKSQKGNKDANRQGKSGSHLVSFCYSSSQSSEGRETSRHSQSTRGNLRNKKKPNGNKKSNSNFLYSR